MLKKAKPRVASLALGLIFALPGLIHAMAPEQALNETQCMTVNKNDIYKMWLFQQVREQAVTGEALPEFPRDVQNVIGVKLHKLSANPVLDGNLTYKRPSDGQQFTFKIKDLVNYWGVLDLSNQAVFGDAKKHLVITTDPTRFFQIGRENESRVVILVAPRFLIEEQLTCTTKAFAPIMASWKKDVAPIGIFWRWGDWKDLNWFDYLTDKNRESISNTSLLILKARTNANYNRYATYSTAFGWQPKWPTCHHNHSEVTTYADPFSFQF